LTYPEPLFIGQNRQHFTEIDSTNVFAAELLAKTTPSEGTVISADYQRQGKGQIGRSWYNSPAQNLQLSVILRPHWLAPAAQFGLSQAVALAVAATVQHFLPVALVQVKWPNDVYLENKKVAGILIQNTLAGSVMKWSVVGIGLNVNEATFPAELPQATSLCQWTDTPLDREAVLRQLFAALEQHYLLLRRHPGRIQRAYLQQLYRYQEWHPYRERATNAVFRAQILGVRPDGRLVLQLADNSLREFVMQEVGFE
jgi:BirA family biotin operon repressor/biotin-[acetyl-CoA-carboxylase] ligase